MATRQQFVQTAVSYLGAVRGSAKHRRLIDIFNQHKPDGWPMNYVAPWCAASVSAWAYELGIGNLIPVSANCGTMVSKAKQMGIWIESDSYTPSPGDLILYDWQDSGYGDNAGGPDHVGVVVSVGGGMITVIEGNKGAASVVGYRSVPINGRYIRGFVRPNFDGVSTVPPSSSSGNYGLYKVNSPTGLNVRKGPGTNYARIATLSNGTPLRIVEMSSNWGRSVGAGGWVCMDYLTKSGATSAPAYTPSNASAYAVGRTYQLISDMRVRTGPGTGYRQRAYSELTADGKRHALAGSLACLRAGTQITCLEMRGDWMRIPSGWICARQGSKVYIK